MTQFAHINKLGNINTSGFLNIEKAKKFPVGTIHNGYKRIAEGKWKKVSKHGLTKKEHKELSDKLWKEADEHDEEAAQHAKGGETSSGNFEAMGKHEKQASEKRNQSIKHEIVEKKLDDKEYDDAHVFGKKYSNGASGEDTFLTPKNNEKNPNDNSKKNHEIATKNVERELKKLDDEEKMDKKVNDVVDKFGNYKSGSVGLDKDGKLKLEKSFVSLCDNDSLQKSHIANMFGYGQEAIKIEKTGKDIKAALQDIKTKNEVIKDIVAEKIKTLKSEIGTEPNQECDSYIIEGFEDRLGLLPNKYSWQEIYNEEKCDTNTTVTLENTEAQKSTCDKKREYNELVNKFVSYSVEILQTDTILNNISDDKKYQLTVKQAAILGF